MEKFSVVKLLLSLVTISNFLVAFCAFIAFVLSYQVIYNHFFHPLSSYPGPFLAGVTRMWVAWHNFTEDETDVCWKLVKEHGPIVRISPNLLLVAKADYLPDIYHRRSVKTNHYNLLGFGRTPSVFHSIKHADHISNKKMVASAYNFSSMKGLEQTLDRRIIQWINRLKGRYDGREVFDFASWATFLAIDFISEIACGKNLGCVEKGCDTEGLDRGFKAGLPAFGFVTRMHVAAAWANWSWIGRFMEWWVPRDNTVGVLMRFVRKAVKERMNEMGANEEGQKKDDMLQRLLDARSLQGESMSSTSLEAELTLALFAGFHTTAGSSCAIIIDALRSPHALAKILSEYQIGRDLGLLSPVPQQAEVLEHCPYYVACVKESMRLSPIGRTIFPRVVTSDQRLVLEGREIPLGTEVACNPWIAHRDSRIYGPDAEIWNPERWLQNGGDSGRFLEKYNLGLGYGSTVCLGRDLGMMELLKFPLIFLTSFEATLCQQSDASPMRIRCRGGMVDWENVILSIRSRKEET